MLTDLIWLLATTLFYGLLLTYAVGVIPAAVLTGLHRRWGYFLTGFVTFGITWYIGSFEILSPSRRKVLLGAGAVLLIGFLAARPAVLAGVDAKPLQRSVDRFWDQDQCRPAGDDWICGRYDDAISGSRPYRVEVDWLGCWEATAKVEPGEGPDSVSDPSVSGCLTLIDLI